MTIGISLGTRAKHPWQVLAMAVIAIVTSGGVTSVAAPAAAEGRQDDPLPGQGAAAEAAALVEEREPEAWPRVLEEGDYRRRSRAGTVNICALSRR